MASLRRVFTRRGLVHGLLLASISIAPRILSAQADTAGAVAGLDDYLAACAADGGHLWGRTLCGPMILVDPASRTALATEQPPGGEFQQTGHLWRGAIPAGISVANTSITWVGREWAMVLLPVPADRYLRLQLLLHESFHRIQDSLGVRGRDAMNAQLDEREGRYWLRLELRAMAAAVQVTGAERRRRAEDALLFRAARLALYPGADTLENQLEAQEGLPEYTGARVALTYLRLPESRTAREFRAFESRPTFVRALGYGTGPGLGLLLDSYAPGWRTRVARDGVAPQLVRALRFRPPADPVAAARTRVGRYGADSLAREEDARAAEHARQLADARARLVDGPVLLLRQHGLARAFNPNTLIAMGNLGTIYPTGHFGAEWGSLDVTEGGALVSADFNELRVPLPADSGGRVIAGKGWKLELANGWKLVPGRRPGDWEVGRD